MRRSNHTTRIAVILGMAIACLGLPQTVQAATYYVATTGNDANSTTQAKNSTTPWKTIGHAAGIAVAGDTVLVGPGAYNEQLRPANSGTSGNLITFKSQTSRTAVLNYSSQNNVDFTDKSYIRIEGFEITGGWNGIILTSADHIEIVDNYVHDYSHDPGTTGAAIYGGGNHTLIESNEVTDCQYGAYGGSYLTLRNNHIHDTSNDAFHGGADHMLIENNIINSWAKSDLDPEAHADGFDFQGDVTDTIIRNNIIYDYQQPLYFPMNDGPNVVYANIDIYGNVIYGVALTATGWDMKGIFFDARVTSGGSISNIAIHSNTIGFIRNFAAIKLLSYPSGNTVSGYIKIYDNLIWGYSGQDGVFADDNFSPHTISDYNLIYNGTKASFELAHTQVGQNPHFVDYAEQDANHCNFHLATNSPAINAGNPALVSAVALPSPFVDIDGTIRPQGSTFDIGAYEYAPNPLLTFMLIGANSTVVSWSSSFTNFALQQNSDITTTNWSDYGGIVYSNSTLMSITNYPPTNHMFFRLKQQ